MFVTNALCTCLCVFLNLLYFVNGSIITKGSLTFVIDDTGSMYDDIDQVKSKTHALFNAVLESNGTNVDDFILVTFNDPGVKLRTITRDQNEFRQALDNIQVGGGDDCPEYAMSGIELALEKSKPNSFFYVYTDASAKDYKQFERVKSLSIKKSTQVNFLLTGECSGSYSEDFVVYNKLAEATYGEVFHIKKHEIGKIIDYIIESTKNVKTILIQKFLKEGSEKQFQFNVDSKEWDVKISVSSDNPKFYITGADGDMVDTKNSVLTEKTMIEKMIAKPGTYTIHLESNRGTSVTITASTDVTFKQGFSSIEPESLNETATKPISGEKSYLAISLENDKKDVKLKTVQVRDTNDNINMELPLKLVNEDQQFYVSESFVPPTKRFKLAVVGYTDSKEKIVRLGSTAIETQDVSLEKKITNTLPLVSILGGPKINAEYDEPLKVKCKLHAYPKPDVVWEDSFGGVWPSSTVPVDLPYEYISTLNLEKVNKNLTITCKAVNVVGKGVTTVNIETKRKTFLNILKFPRDVTIPYGDTVDFQFIVDAYPSVTITWYKDSKPIVVNEEFEILRNNSVLTIKNMNYHHIGNYNVEASNEYHKENVTFKVSIHAEIPHIDKSKHIYVVEKGSEVIMNCRLTQGYPLPKISWLNNKASNDPTDLGEADGSFRIINATKDDSGTYMCMARNEIGKDSHAVDLIVQYPPFTDKNDEHINVRDGDKIVLTCTFYGEPLPRVKWFKNDVELSSSSKYRTYRYNSILRFAANEADNGVFTCKAANTLGKAERNIYINVYIPVHIDPPEETTLTLSVGSELTLTCNAHGVPKPDVNWTFYSYVGKTEKTLRGDKENSIKIPRIQTTDEGSYVCEANNTAGSVFLTYEVYVTAPPTIVNTLVDKTLTGVEGDLVLRIPCMVVGSPKPIISWMVDGDYLAIDTDWYGIEKDGTLIIKNLSKSSAGTYKCVAKNPVGSDFEEFEVEVQPYPRRDEVSSTIKLKEGSSTNIECDLPHEKKDLVRWYREARFINTGELYLSNVTTTDSGIYTCRVSNFLYSHSSHKKIIVGQGPQFITDEETNIEFNEGSTVFLGCNAINSAPTTEWFCNGNKIDETSNEIFFELKLSDIGNYTCLVSNEFGTISRTFYINLQECLLNIESDLNDQQPLMLTFKREWKTFNIKNDGFIRIPKLNEVLLLCPESRVTSKESTFSERAFATCIDKTTFKINGKHVDFNELKCSNKNRPLAKVTGVNCDPASNNTELMTVGFNIRSRFLGVYDVCIDKDRKVPIFAKHILYRSFANRIPKALTHINFIGSTRLPFDFDYMYQCISVRSIIEDCCYSKRQLINPRDVLPGLPQVATYNYLNVVPHQSTCGSENWDEIERRVRQLAQELNQNLEVWTGASRPIKSPVLSAIPKDAYLNDSFDQRQPIAPFIWKVIQNPEEDEAIAIIQINIPDLTIAKAVSYMPCRDICHRVEWMRRSEWYNVEKGFTFCCSVEDFKSVFGFKDQFKDAKNILASHLVPKHALT